MSIRTLYLARHGEPTVAATGLSDVGRAQASRLGQRLKDTPVRSIVHGPSARAAQTAAIVLDQIGTGVAIRESRAAGDYVPAVPESASLEPHVRPRLAEFVSHLTQDDVREGEKLAAQAIDQFAGLPSPERCSDELVITHAFTIGHLVAHALGAPAWRWWGLNHGHAALTVIRYALGRPATLLVFNDMSHLFAPQRWTGFARDLRL